MSEMDDGFSFGEPISGWEPEDSTEGFPGEDPYDPMHQSGGTGETYASPYLQEIAEVDLPTASGDTDQDGVLDTVSVDTDGDGCTDMTEHVRDDGSSLTEYDADGDENPEVRAEGASAGEFTELSFNEGPEAVQDLPQTLPPPPMFGSETAIVAGSAMETKSADELIIARDGTGYTGPADFVSGQNGWTPVTFAGQYRFDVPDAPDHHRP
ncbi:hypothetical protein [Streptomyces sp. bgisy034]|uniref:hypothetical protein n=1 Tax=Streptomyces sp. bgisy034 TaxID=3413774 RepID=UPI003EB80745